MPDSPNSRIARLEQRTEDHELDIQRLAERHERDMRAFGEEVGKNLQLETRFNAFKESFDEFKTSILRRLDTAEEKAGEAKRWRVSTYIAAVGLLVTVLSVAVTIVALVLSQ